MNAARSKLDGVFLENRQPLVRMLIGFVGSATTAEDLAHEVYVRVLIASRDRQIDNLRAFLYRTARNLALARQAELIRGMNRPVEAPPDVLDRMRELLNSIQ